MFLKSVLIGSMIMVSSSAFAARTVMNYSLPSDDPSEGYRVRAEFESAEARSHAQLFVPGEDTAFANDSLKLTGNKAAALQSALLDMGAKSLTRAGVTYLHVQSVDCQVGLIPGNMPRDYAECIVEQLIPVSPMTPAFRRVTLRAKAPKARAVITALNDAGVKDTMGSAVIMTQTGRVNCTSRAISNQTRIVCKVEVAE